MENIYKQNKESIKKYWDQMLPSTRKEAMNSILNENDFDVTDVIYVKQTWIWGGRVPKNHQAKVVEIFQNALKIQSKNAIELLNKSENQSA